MTYLDDSHVRCHLIYYNELPFEQGWVSSLFFRSLINNILQLRLACEIAVITLIAIQIMFDVRDIRQIGWGKWVKVYVR